MTIDAKLALHGGTPVRSLAWHTADRGDVDLDERDNAAVQEVMASRRLFRYDGRPIADTATGRFESALREYFGTRFALAVSGGTAAITAALLAADLPRASHVACSAFTFQATPSAVMLAGHSPVLVDSTPDLHMDPRALAELVAADDSIAAVVVVHMRGMAADIGAVLDVSNAAGIPVIEDASGAVGGVLRGKPVGTLGAAGAFSTQSHKSLDTGEGGFVLSSDPRLFERLLAISGAYDPGFSNHCRAIGIEPTTSPFDAILPNFRMDEIRGALAWSQMRKLAHHLASVRANYDALVGEMRDVPNIALRRPVAADGVIGEALLFRVPDADVETVELFAQALSAEGIPARAFGSPGDANHRAFWNWRFMFEDPDTARALLPATTRHLCETIDVALPFDLDLSARGDLITALHKVAASTDISRRLDH